jgi:hypothetical protein
MTSCVAKRISVVTLDISAICDEQEPDGTHTLHYLLCCCITRVAVVIAA